MLGPPPVSLHHSIVVMESRLTLAYCKDNGNDDGPEAKR